MSDDEDRFEQSRANAGSTIKMAGVRAFAESILFREIAAPLYKIKNAIYIFDYANGHILSYNLDKPVKSVDINFHKTLKWKTEMIVDEQTDRAFAHFVIGGISELREISLITGQLEHTTKIPYPFVKNIKAKNNYFYFLFKGQEYDDTRYLSRIRIN